MKLPYANHCVICNVSIDHFYLIEESHVILLTMIPEPLVFGWILSVVKAWVGEILRAPYISTEMIAHGTMSCDCG